MIVDFYFLKILGYKVRSTEDRPSYDTEGLGVPGGEGQNTEDRQRWVRCCGRAVHCPPYNLDGGGSEGPPPFPPCLTALVWCQGV